MDYIACLPYGLKAIPIPRENAFRNLMVVYALWLTGMFFAGSLFEVYFFNMGLSIPQIYLADAFWFVGGLVLLPLFKRFNAKPFMLAGIAVAFASALMLYLFPDPSAAYVYRIMLGTTHLLFWLPFNIRFFEFRRQNHATLSAVYYAVPPILYLILPAVSGTVAEEIGFPSLFVLAMVTYGLSFIIAFLTFGDRSYRYDLCKSLRAIRGLRLILFLEGFSVMAITAVTLPTMLLLYTNRPIEFGWFISLATVFSVASSFLVSKLSDKTHRRWVFILSSAGGFALASILAGLTPGIALFFLSYGVINFFARLFTPISLALAVDKARNLVETMAAREFMLNVGRLSGVLLGYLIIVDFGIEAALIFQGLVLLLYVPVFELRARKILRI
jgi:hypothetical protein